MRYFSFKTIIPLVIIVLCAFFLYLFGPATHLTLAAFKEKESLVFSWIALHPFLSALILSSTYIFSICLFIPAVSVLSLIAGIAYPFPYAFALSVFSETLGACLFFIILRCAFHPIDLCKEGTYLKKAQEGFKKNPASYLLFLRFSHITPSWLITALAIIFKSSFWTFAWTSFLGTIPMSYLIVEAGETLKKAHKVSYSFNWDTLLNTNTKLLFLGFAILALLPIFIKKFVKR